MSHRTVMYMVWDTEHDRVVYRGKRATKAARASNRLDRRGIPNITNLITKPAK